jgi:uncharacterized protein
MDIELTAQMKSWEDFYKLYKDGDEKKEYYGKSLIFYSLTNNNLEARYKISNFLLSKNVDIKGKTKDGYSALQVLLGQNQHDFAEMEQLFEKLVSLGVDVNFKDNLGQMTIQYLARLRYSDEELCELYDMLFALPNLDLKSVDKLGHTPLEFVEALPYRKGLAERIKTYERENG